MKPLAITILLALTGCAKLEVSNQYGSMKFTGNLGSMTSTIRERSDAARIPLLTTATSELLLDVKEAENSLPSISMGPEGFLMTGIVDTSTKADIQGHWISRVADRIGNVMFWKFGFDMLEGINAADNAADVAQSGIANEVPLADSANVVPLAEIESGTALGLAEIAAETP